MTFFALAFGISWALWVPAALFGSRSTLLVVLAGAFGPTLAALLRTALHDGRRGLKRLLGRLPSWRVGAGWYLVMLLGTAAVGFLTILPYPLFGGPPVSFSPAVPPAFLPVVFLVSLLFGGPLNEEAGWRGYTLPRLQSEKSALSSSLILGLVWGLWHLPLFFVGGTSQSGWPFVPFVLWTVALSVLLAWVYNNTGGSLLLAVLAHGAVNFTAGFLFPIFPAAGAEDATPFLLYAALLGVAAVAVVLLAGPRRLSCKKPLPEEATAY